MSFAELEQGLRQAKEQRLVYERPGPDGLALYVYSEKCIYDGVWNPITLSARGLILDRESRRIVATPFPKFFNVGEHGQQIPTMQFETMEKLDGSLIIIFNHNGRWRVATKGAFDSAQAGWAQRRLDEIEHAHFTPGVTYLAEAVYPENRIVIRYDEAALVILAAYDERGVELSNASIEVTAAALGWRTAKRYSFNSISDMLTHAQTLPRTEEGFVLRFENGLRLKVKGSEYRRIHALISRVTPLAMWEAMVAGDDLDRMRRDLPEEFWNDFDAIRNLLNASYENLIDRAKAAADEVRDLSDKEVGLRLAKFNPDVRSFIFPLRKSAVGQQGLNRIRQMALRDIRPTSNVLPGYVASYAVTRVNEESN